MEISTNNIGFAAFVLINDGFLLSVEEGEFQIEGNKSKIEYMIDYTNSICSIRDLYVRCLLSYWQLGVYNPQENADFWSKKLGFSAYLLTENVKLIGFEDKKYWFKSEFKMDHWQAKYEGSVCEIHDNKVNELRTWMKSNVS
jgi:hypothetical protein